MTIRDRVENSGHKVPTSGTAGGLTMGKSTRAGVARRYSAAERREAIALCEEMGPANAARQLKIPTGTVTCWVTKHRRGELDVGTTADDEAAEADVDEVSRDEEAEAKDEQDGIGKRKVAKIYTPSQRAEILEYAAAHGITKAHRKFGAARWTIYAWEKQVQRAAKGEADAPTAGPDPADVEAQRDREILDEWERHPGLGPSQIKNQLRRKSIKISTNTVRRVMIDAGYRPPKRKTNRHDRRYEAVRPNHIWHMDFVARYIHRAKTFTLILLDDHSRFVLAHGVDDAERGELVMETFERAVERHGKPEAVVHDKGSAFWAWRGISRFTKLLEEMEIEQIPATKQTNGKIEVFNANIQKELFDVVTFQSLAEMQRRLKAHLHGYNHRRTSHALGGLLVPADRYYGRVEEVLARIEAGVVDDADPLGLVGRALELFKVSSVGGRTEVWLMGTRMFPPE